LLRFQPRLYCSNDTEPWQTSRGKIHWGSEWKDVFQPDKKGRLIWYTEASKSNERSGGWVQSYGTSQKFSFDLGKYTTVFQAGECMPSRHAQ
jgi:hypothetical protein